MSSALIRLDWQSQAASMTAAASALKEEALECSALIGKVVDAASQEAAVAAQQKISDVLINAEKARKAAKEPALEFGRRIDVAAKLFVHELKEEQVRLATLVGDFQQLEQARVRAEQQAENERLSALERERMRALANATSYEERDRVQERFAARQVAESPPTPIAPVRAEGQRVVPDWEVSITDIWLLAKAHPACVKIEPLIGEIKGLLKAGVKVAGVNAKPILKAGVSRVKQLPAIEV